jgi:Cys-rich repeat protein
MGGGGRGGGATHCLAPPGVCVECLTNAQCGGGGAVCDTAHTCQGG